MKILLCLSWESKNNISCDRDRSLERTNLINKSITLLCWISTEHFLEHGIWSWLKRNMNMWTKLWFSLMKSQKLIRIIRRIRRSISEPLQTFQLQNLLYNSQEIWMLIHDLPQKNNFLNSISKMNLCLFNDLLNRKPSLQSSSERYNTISTKLITSSWNWDISGLIMSIHTWVDPLWNNCWIFIC